MASINPLLYSDLIYICVCICFIFRALKTTEGRDTLTDIHLPLTAPSKESCIQKVLHGMGGNNLYIQLLVSQQTKGKKRTRVKIISK